MSAGDAADVDKAVKAAYAALRDPSWKKLPADKRGQLMAKLADKIEENRELLATVETWDNGKAYSDAVSGDLNEAIGVIRYYAGWCDKISGQTIPCPTSSPTPCASLLASSARSSPGTTRCPWPPGSWARPWPAATPSS